jgi:peptide/nickel transport system permease protein
MSQPFTLGEFWFRFRKNRLATLGLAVIIGVVFLAVAAPILSPYDPSKVVGSPLERPFGSFLFGTDSIGRDLLSRTIWGSRVAIMVGLVAAGLSTAIGVALGGIAGYYGGKADALLMRFCEILIVIPRFFLYILIVAVTRTASPLFIAVLLGLTEWTRLAKIVRVDFMSLKERDFAVAAKAMGGKDIRIILRHLLPNDMAPIIVSATMEISGAIVMEAALSFVGVGDPTVVSWGVIMSQGRELLGTAWWITTLPGIVLFLAVMGFNFLGDGLRDSLDPRLRGSI